MSQDKDKISSEVLLFSWIRSAFGQSSEANAFWAWRLNQLGACIQRVQGDKTTLF